MKRGLIKFRSAFTLLEVLVAGGVLFIVTAAVVSLSNTIIQGTGHNADRTEVNRWASEGMELVTKIRNDSVKTGGVLIGQDKIWFGPAESNVNYGWYRLEEQTAGNTTSWQLVKTDADKHLHFNQVATYAGLPLQNQALVGYRLICIEAYGATDQSSDADYLNCNTADEAGTNAATDGDRLVTGSCQTDDVYCLASFDSLNRNRQSRFRYIPSGNVVKVRTVVVWNERNQYQSTEIGSILSNWKGSEQEL